MVRPKLKVGIVGAGISGLYTGLLLQDAGHDVRIFEGTGRVGGRVYTHYFTPEANQYYEAGAMRIPHTHHHEIVFDLVNYLNTKNSSEKDPIQLIEYNLTTATNQIYLNKFQATLDCSLTPSQLGWNVTERFKNEKAQDLLHKAILPFIDELKNLTGKEFEKKFEEIVDEWDDYTFRYYCKEKLKWDNNLIDFVETVMSQTNQFSLSVPELVMQSIDFNEKEWKTIDKGMSRLPQAMAKWVGLEKITFGARVTGVEETDKGVTIKANGYNGVIKADFDRVVLAIPPAALRMIGERPQWDIEKEMAIRSIHFEPLYKMGLRFKTRFWENGMTPTQGGQDTTDYPIRWVVYPSNGKGSEGPGVLLIYAWMTDAINWIPLTALERRSLALQHLSRIYKMPNLHEELIESSDFVWSESTATGDAMFLPGQFREHFKLARKNEKNIYFAGEHLSYHHTWISGAAHSALKVVQDMLGQPNLPPLKNGQFLSALQGQSSNAGNATFYSFDVPLNAPYSFLVSRSRAPYIFRPRISMDRFGPIRKWNEGDEDSDYHFPTNLGQSGVSTCGEETTLGAPNERGLYGFGASVHRSRMEWFD